MDPSGIRRGFFPSWPEMADIAAPADVACSLQVFPVACSAGFRAVLFNVCSMILECAVKGGIIPSGRMNAVVRRRIIVGSRALNQQESAKGYSDHKKQNGSLCKYI
jgi:hypothetical protein